MPKVTWPSGADTTPAPRQRQAGSAGTAWRLCPLARTALASMGGGHLESRQQGRAVAPPPPRHGELTEPDENPESHSFLSPSGELSTASLNPQQCCEAGLSPFSRRPRLGEFWCPPQASTEHRSSAFATASAAPQSRFPLVEWRADTSYSTHQHEFLGRSL